MTEEFDFENRTGTFKIGEMVMVNPVVTSSDSMRNYVDEQHPLLELIEVKRQPTDPQSRGHGSGAVLLKSWDGRETERTGWAIAKVSALKTCMFCTSPCKKEDICAFFYSVMEGIK